MRDFFWGREMMVGEGAAGNRGILFSLFFAPALKGGKGRKELADLRRAGKKGEKGLGGKKFIYYAIDIE